MLFFYFSEQLKPQDFQRRLNDNTGRNIIMVRDPLQRLLSAYRDKYGNGISINKLKDSEKIIPYVYYIMYTYIQAH